MSRAGWAAQLVLAATVAAAVTSAPTPVLAQGIWPERAENLTELPADLSAGQLRAVMQGFTRALGVRCSYCHVGQEGQPLSTFDFVSDANPNKERTRAMLRMLAGVRADLDAMSLSDDAERVEVGCHTCHAGRPRPQTLAEAVGEVWRAEGGAAALEHYRVLRQRYFGGPAYDFRAPAVNGLAMEVAAAGDTATARAFLLQVTEEHPADAAAWELLGDLAATEGDLEAAAAHYDRALERAPGVDRILRKRERVGGGGVGTLRP